MKVFIVIASIVILIGFFIKQSLRREEEVKEILRKRNSGEYDLEKSIRILEEQIDDNQSELQNALISQDESKEEACTCYHLRLIKEKETLQTQLNKMKNKNR